MFASPLAIAAFLQSAVMIPETKASDPVPLVPLASLVTLDDYPAQALANKQSGTVRVRLDVAANGRVDGCTVLRSSRSSILDASTCRLLRSRARFTPARDTAGRPAAGRVEDELRWTLGATSTAQPRLNALTSIWTTCVTGDAARRSVSTMDANLIPDAAYATCAEIEPMLLAEMTRANLPKMVPTEALRGLKLQYRTRLAAQVGAVRRTLSAK